MTPEDFEEYVALVIHNLTITKNSRVSRNRRFEGKRQSGHYEIDIAVEFRIEDLLDLLIIVECKNWKRPVDRPVIQKLAQTRDAISAHKAAVVSPVGFTKEAFEVSRDLGIALWVLSFAEELPMINAILLRKTGAQIALEAEQFKAYNKRKGLLTLIHFANLHESVRLFTLIDAFRPIFEFGPTHYDDDRSRDVLADRIRTRIVQGSCPGGLDVGRAIRAVAFSHHLSRHNFGSGEVGVDPQTASAQVADVLLGGLGGIMKVKRQLNQNESSEDSP